jgi:hypothetical protein
MKRTLAIFLSLIVAVPAFAGDKDAKATIEYVQKLQTNTGGFLSQTPAPNIRIVPTLRATSSAVRTLHYLGGELKNKEAVVKFVESCWDAEAGGFSDMPKGKPGVFETAVGLMAVVELKMPADKYAGAGKYLRENAKTFEEIRIAAAGFEAIKKQPADVKAWTGGIMEFPRKNARDEASVTVTLMRFGVQPTAPAEVLKVLNKGQRKTGGWNKMDDASEPDLETTYRVMRCYRMLKARPDDADGVRAFIAKCRNADGGYGVAPGQTSTGSGTYFAAIITHWLNEKK